MRILYAFLLACFLVSATASAEDRNELRFGAFVADADPGATTEGVSLSYLFHWDGWRLQASYSYTDDNHGGGVTGTREWKHFHAGVAARRTRNELDKSTYTADLIAGWHQEFTWWGDRPAHGRLGLRCSRVLDADLSDGQAIGDGCGLVLEILWPWGIVQEFSWLERDVTNRGIEDSTEYVTFRVSKRLRF